MGYLKPALNNPALIKRDWLEIWLGYGATYLDKKLFSKSASPKPEV